jgi:Tol biopolymer transport system component
MSVEHLAFSPDRKAVVYTTFPDRLLMKANSNGSNPIQMTDGSMSSAMNPKWSPTGDRILFTDSPVYATARAYLVSSRGGKPQRLLPNDTESEEDSDWSPDGTKVVLSGGNPNSEDQRYIRILDLASNTWTKLRGSENLITPQWSPDGRYIVALSSRTRSLRVFDLRSQHWSELRATSNISCPVVSSDGQYVYYMQSAGPTPRTYEIYRIRVIGGEPQLIADLKPWPLDGLWGPSMTLDPSDTPIVTRDAGTSDVYSLKIGFK